VNEVGQKKGVKSAYAICTASNAGNIKQVRKSEAANKRKGGKRKPGY
jgi:hypothetical protein